jgi:hypothetical protein
MHPSRSGTLNGAGLPTWMLMIWLSGIFAH